MIEIRGQAEAAGTRLSECSSSLADAARRVCCPSLLSGWFVGGNTCAQLIDTLLLTAAALALLVWLLLPEGWFCDTGMLGASLLALSLWRSNRELRMRVAFEQSAQQLTEENAALKASSQQLSSDLVMLQDTIGALGDKGDDWLGQLRFLHAAQKRENDRHGMLLRGHARIVLLQL